MHRSSLYQQLLLASIHLLLSTERSHGFAPQRSSSKPSFGLASSMLDAAAEDTASPSSTDKDEDELLDEASVPSKREIVASARIILPFGAATAFDAFADLPRQPSWSPWLRDVSYIDDDEADADAIPLSRDDIPLRTTSWTMGYRGFKFSWNAVSTNLERPNVIEWESTSGLRNYGQVRFDERTLDDKIGKVETEMVLAMKFRAPRVIAALFRRSSTIKNVMERMLEGTLDGFRDVVMEEDLGLSLDRMEEEEIR